MNHPLAEQDEAVSVSARSLIELRSAGEALLLPHTRIQAGDSGGYLSPHKGRGVEFEESRPYQPGDDVRNIDWRVTARTGRTHTKLFREERERPVLFSVDFRASMFFATRGAFKSVVAARTAALLAWSSHHHGDRVGGLLFSEDNHRELRPQRGKIAVLRLIRALVEFARWRGPVAPPPVMPLSSPLARLRRVARPGSLVFVISDFRLMDEGVERHLAQLARHNSVVLLAIHDPLEAELPPPGLYRLTDGERDALLDSADARVREHYREQYAGRVAQLHGLCRRYGLSFIPLQTNSDLTASLRGDLLRRPAVRPASNEAALAVGAGS